MPVTVVVGGQYGSEGKGKVSAILAKEMDATAVVRCGGPNSGHTVYDDSGRKYVFRQFCLLFCSRKFGDFIPILMKDTGKNHLFAVLLLIANFVTSQRPRPTVRYLKECWTSP